jgi:hypothetical protein
MRPKLFTFIATLSLLLCVAASVLWVRSYRVSDIYCNYRAGRYRQVVSSRGQLQLAWGPTSYPDATTWTSRPWPYIGVGTGPVPTLDWQFLGFMSFTGTTNGVPRRFSELFAPDWSFAMLFGTLPAVWAVLRLRARRFAAGRCPACGYDLRATPNRCPECGAMSAPQTAA